MKFVPHPLVLGFEPEDVKLLLVCLESFRSLDVPAGIGQPLELEFVDTDLLGGLRAPTFCLIRIGVGPRIQLAAGFLDLLAAILGEKICLTSAIALPSVIMPLL